MSAATGAAAMLIALAVDRALGEPPARLHPVVAMGRYLGAFEGRLLALAPRAAFLAGALVWTAGAGAVVAIAWCVQALLLEQLTGPWLAAVVLGLLLKPLLAWRMLEAEVSAVETALGENLDAGRARVARLVSRDTATLGETEVRETAIETLAENFNDSVIAPLFWFALAGLPGAALYRYANTADAMWGYRGPWEWAGKWAARADDALSWLPARLSGLALLPRPARWPSLAREAVRTPSPNGGWPMGAMALALGVRLSKPAVYVLNDAGRAVTHGDVARAVTRQRRALAIAVLPLLALAAWRASA